ncbi:MAG: Unknown protein [uncultured Campylobacterales bacterium]|uniref:Lipoprotein n=1 Tax=uncultured Campylobacterales bacterium TaxID=352960 RepID=A0A6S6SST0_9BACT|nr:MAG: Unknown protein [uncultured Campylobacterales bacterium]
MKNTILMILISCFFIGCGVKSIFLNSNEYLNTHHVKFTPPYGKNWYVLKNKIPYGNTGHSREILYKHDIPGVSYQLQVKTMSNEASNMKDLFDVKGHWSGATRNEKYFTKNFNWKLNFKKYKEVRKENFEEMYAEYLKNLGV